MAAYVGRSAYEIVSGLFFTGWDNQGHFTTFANTYVEQSTTWPTVDGSTAWNQWYPSLQTTVMALAEQAWRVVDTPLDRPGLLWPYVQWNAILFALSLAALAWVAGDLAARLGGRDRERWTRPLAAGGFAAFALLGSPALLYNSGFTNFVIGVVVVVVAAYLGARSWRSARTLGWFVVPLAAVAVIGLWTPLALGLVPTGVFVAIALFRYRRWLGAAWLAVTILAAVGLGLTQLQAILGTDPEQSSADISKTFGSVEVGMSSFNAGMALAAPLIVVLLAVLLIRGRNWPMAVAVAGPVLGAALITLAFVVVTDSAGSSRLQSYYVLKPMNAMLLAVAPIVAALVAVALSRALRGVPAVTAGLSVALAAVVVIPLFGYAGALPGAGVGGAARCSRRPGRRRPGRRRGQAPHRRGDPAGPRCRRALSGRRHLPVGRRRHPAEPVGRIPARDAVARPADVLPQRSGRDVRREDPRLRRPDPQPASGDGVRGAVVRAGLAGDPRGLGGGQVPGDARAGSHARERRLPGLRPVTGTGRRVVATMSVAALLATTLATAAVAGTGASTAVPSVDQAPRLPRVPSVPDGTVGKGAPQSVPAAASVSTGEWRVWTGGFGREAGTLMSMPPAGGVPLLGDWNGDGVATPGRYEAGQWFITNASVDSPVWEGKTAFGGDPADIPVVGRYDKDRRADIGVFRNGEWHWQRANGKPSAVEQFGQAGDIPRRRRLGR